MKKISNVNLILNRCLSYFPSSGYFQDWNQDDKLYAGRHSDFEEINGQFAVPFHGCSSVEKRGHMAVTAGHGNPNWTRDEVILTLDLYFDCDGILPSKSDPRVIALSELLRSFPFHSQAARQPSFRNPDGVAFKLQNLRQVATGRGLANVSRIDREVWSLYGSEPVKVKKLADLIRAGVRVVGGAREEEPEYEVFAEGRVVTEAHLRRERNPKLRSKYLAKRSAAGRLHCDICDRNSQQLPEAFAEAVFEVHHLLPLAAGLERITRIADLALLCASCHRLTHKAIALQGKWLTIEQVKVALRKNPGYPPSQSENETVEVIARSSR